MVVRRQVAIPSQLQLLQRLQHLLYLSSSLTFMSGEQGCGKTALLEQLSNQLPDSIQQKRRDNILKAGGLHLIRRALQDLPVLQVSLCLSSFSHETFDNFCFSL